MVAFLANSALIIIKDFLIFFKAIAHLTVFNKTIILWNNY
jgi:hypothetical protein